MTMKVQGPDGLGIESPGMGEVGAPGAEGGPTFKEVLDATGIEAGGGAEGPAETSAAGGASGPEKGAAAGAAEPGRGVAGVGGLDASAASGPLDLDRVREDLLDRALDRHRDMLPPARMHELRLHLDQLLREDPTLSRMLHKLAGG